MQAYMFAHNAANQSWTHVCMCIRCIGIRDSAQVLENARDAHGAQLRCNIGMELGDVDSLCRLAPHLRQRQTYWFS